MWPPIWSRPNASAACGMSNEGTWVSYFISFNADDKRNGIWVQRTDGSGARQLDLWGAYQWRDDSHLLVIPARTTPDQAV